jgi:hypothetical protein
MTATGLVVTDLSHLDVGLDIRGDFRGLVRIAVSSKPSRPARRCDLCINVLRWVGECGELCPLMSISPACGRTCGRFLPGGDGSPAAGDAGGPAGWLCGFTVCCCAPVTVRARPFRVDRGGGGATGASGDGGGLCFVFHLDSVDSAAQRVGGRPASGTYSAGAGSPASTTRVGDGAGV